MAAVVYNSTMVVLSFIQYDVNVDVSVIRNAELPFPAVTICNLTPINRYAQYITLHENWPLFKFNLHLNVSKGCLY